MVLNTVNGLNSLFPAVPAIPTGIRLGEYLTRPPWNALWTTSLGLSPMHLGLAFLMPLNMSFSLWFFHLTWRTQTLISAMYGRYGFLGSDEPYVHQQTFGALMGLLVFLLWMSRGHLRVVLRRALGLSRTPDDSKEGMSYRVSTIGLVAGLAIMAVFAHSIGMAGWLIAGFLFMWLALSLAVTRMRAQIGLPFHDLGNMGADNMVPVFTGTRALGVNNSVAITMLIWSNLNYTTNPMPNQMEGLRLAERAQASRHAAVKAILLASAIGGIAGLWALLHLTYQQGADRFRAPSPFTWPYPYLRLYIWLDNPQDPQAAPIIAVVVGFVVSLILGVLDTRFPGFPLHPVAYAVSATGTMRAFLLAAFVGWLAKLLLLRYGGVRAHRRALPFFLGLILGDIVGNAAFSLLGLAIHLPINVSGWTL
jgi:hypothetical protein